MSEYASSRSGGSHEGGVSAGDSAARSPGKQTLVQQSAPVQLRAEGAAGAAAESSAQSSGDVRELAGKGTKTASSSLPYFDVIQAAFGHHDISGLVAHTDGEAGETAKGMGAKGYTAGKHVVLGPGADLFTVAHEAAHFIEQQHGLVSLPGGVGAVGDIYEQHADEVAGMVVAGQSAEALLDQYVGKSGGTKAGGGAEHGPVQQKKSELGENRATQIPQKLDNARGFERKLGIAAFHDARAHAAATTVIDRMVAAVMPGFNEAEAESQQDYSRLFGRENKGDDNGDRDNGAWSGGQVGTEFAVLREALQNGNLREKMTGIYNAGLGGFKATVQQLMQEDRAVIAARGLDDDKLKRRRNQMTFNPGAKDVYRDPGNPLDRKKYSSYEYTGQTRTAAVGDAQKSRRTMGELDADGIGLSDREKAFQYGGAATDANSPVKWKEGGTYYNVNNDNKWVKKYQQKLLMPVTAGPSGTALRMFQAWEFLAKPTNHADFRLALLGWMLTGNDHSFHEIMTTSADFTSEAYVPGVEAYRQFDPYNEAELRAIAAPEGFPDEENYRTSHVTAPLPQPLAMDARIKAGNQASILTTGPQVARFEELIYTNAAFPLAINGGDLARAMAIITYTDDKNSGDEGVSAFQFINNVLRGRDSRAAMYFFVRKDPQLLEAYNNNKFKLKELVAEAKEHAKYAREGLELLPVFAGTVHRGYKSNSLPHPGAPWSEDKFLSTSKDPAVSTRFAVDPAAHGRYSILVNLVSTRGRDLGEASMFGAGEQEVLYAPGSRFRVSSDPRPWAAGGPNGYEVDWTEA